MFGLVALLLLIATRYTVYYIGDEEQLGTRLCSVKMATHGKLPVFDITKETWTLYAERLTLYLVANGITEPEKKRSILLTACGADAYKTVRCIVQPQTPTDKTYEELVQLLEKHYHPQPSPFISRYKFHTRVRQPNESVATYVAQLKDIGQHCNFGADLDNSVRDRLVLGINDTRIQRRLLQEADVTFAKAFEIAQGMELSAEGLSLLNKSTQPVHRIQQQSSKSQATVPRPAVCYRCGGNHPSHICRFRQAECRSCGKIGHIAKVCRSRAKVDAHAKPKKASTHAVECAPSPPPSSPVPPPSTSPLIDGQTYDMFPIVGRAKPITLSVTVQGKNILMELDTGASLSLISEDTFKSTFNGCLPLNPSNISLRTYSGEHLTVLGTANVEVFYNSQSAVLPLVIVKGQGHSLFGRNWLERIKLDWSAININAIQQSSSLNQLLQEYSSLFRDELGTLKNAAAKISVPPGTQPRFFKAHQVPYALKSKVEKELDRLQEQGIITPVQFSDWAAPIVPVIKSDGSIRLCGDYKVTINQASKLDTYPLPRVEDLFAALSGGKIFSKLDLAHAYQQIPLDENSKKYTTINTSKGLFQYERLPFGVSSAPAIFQRTMDCLLQGLPSVCTYIDDILVAGVDEADHLQNLRRVMDALQSAGLTLKQSKCICASSSVEYLGHVIDGDGIHPSSSKVQAIKEPLSHET